MISLVLGTPEQGCQTAQYRRKGDGHHDNGQHGLADHRAQHQPLDQQAHDDGHPNGCQQSSPYRQAQRHQKRIAKIATDQNKVTLGDVKHLRAFQNDHKADGDQGINHALGKTGYN